MRIFELHRDIDVNGLSGTGTVAEGVEFTNGTVAMMWAGAWPTSVVFHDRGMESVIHLHSHEGKTRVVYLDTFPHVDAAVENDLPQGEPPHVNH